MCYWGKVTRIHKYARDKDPYTFDVLFEDGDERKEIPDCEIFSRSVVNGSKRIFDGEPSGKREIAGTNSPSTSKIDEEERTVPEPAGNVHYLKKPMEVIELVSSDDESEDESEVESKGRMNENEEHMSRTARTTQVPHCFDLLTSDDDSEAEMDMTTGGDIGKRGDKPDSETSEREKANEDTSVSDHLAMCKYTDVGPGRNKAYPQLPPYLANAKWPAVKKHLWNVKKVYGRHFSLGPSTDVNFYPKNGGQSERGGKFWDGDFVRSESCAKYISAKRCGWEGGTDELPKLQVLMEREVTREREESSRDDDSGGDYPFRPRKTRHSRGCVSGDTSSNAVYRKSISEKTVVTGKKRAVSNHRVRVDWTAPTDAAEETVVPPNTVLELVGPKKANAAISPSTRLAREILREALPDTGYQKYEGKLSKLVSGSLQVSRQHLTEEDLDFMTAADRRAVWRVIWGDRAADEELRKTMSEVLCNVSTEALDNYAKRLAHDGYDATDFEDVETIGLDFMRKAHRHKLLAAFGLPQKRRETS